MGMGPAVVLSSLWWELNTHASSSQVLSLKHKDGRWNRIIVLEVPEVPQGLGVKVQSTGAVRGGVGGRRTAYGRRCRGPRVDRDLNTDQQTLIFAQEQT